MGTKFQAPRGTRDFYPDQMAWRQYLVDAWRRVSIRNGFEQVEGPVFESLDLYKAKSGEGIVNELFHFTDRGDRELAIRPEFTPTLARMVAAKANALPRPIKWFCTPNLCRAERPQRGRLREFLQWNCDIIGSDSAVADAECILTAVDLLRELDLTPADVRVKISHRKVVGSLLKAFGVQEDKLPAMFDLLDRRSKVPREDFEAQASALGLDKEHLHQFDGYCSTAHPLKGNPINLDGGTDVLDSGIQRLMGFIRFEDTDDIRALNIQLSSFGIADWCEYDLSIVRGLAYYTGTVFEIHESSGAERALAGGGRYDNLIEQFGGPPLPAVGFGMGDVVLTNLLTDKGLLPKDFIPTPDVFVIAETDAGVSSVPQVVATLRQGGDRGDGLHVRFSYKATRNVGKLLKEASGSGARFAVILGGDGGLAIVKDLSGGTQQEMSRVDLADHLHRELSTR